MICNTDATKCPPSRAPAGGLSRGFACLLGQGARSGDGGTGVGGSAIGRRGKGLALAILLITSGAKTVPKGEVIGPASFAFFPHACLADFGGHAAFS
jgi:hypothetical protein